jgi:hypothetical protein
MTKKTLIDCHVYEKFFFFIFDNLKFRGTYLSYFSTILSKFKRLWEPFLSLYTLFSNPMKKKKRGGLGEREMIDT